MKTAKEAREELETMVNKDSGAELADIEEFVKIAITKRRNWIELPSLMDATIKKLKTLGYQIKTYWFADGYTISW